MKILARVSLAALALTFLSIRPIAAEDQHPPSDLQKIKDRGKIVMLCVPGQENPFISTRIEKGPMKRRASPEFFQGIDVELMSILAQDLGVELEIVPAVGEGEIPTYSELIPALLRGEGDVIASAFSITPARQKDIDFSKPYFHNEVVVITRKQAKISKESDLANLRYAYLPRTSLEEFLADLEVDNLVGVEMEMLLDTYSAVSEGTADFLVDDLSAGVARFLDLFDNLDIAFSLPIDDTFALGLRPGSDLREPLDRALDKLRESGRLQEIISVAKTSQMP